MTLQERIQALGLERKNLKIQRAKVMKEYKNAKRRNTRLKKKTRQLSTNDLLEVLGQRRADETAPAPATGEASPAS